VVADALHSFKVAGEAEVIAGVGFDDGTYIYGEVHTFAFAAFLQHFGGLAMEGRGGGGGGGGRAPWNV
jgi:hypothetical protein